MCGWMVQFYKRLIYEVSKLHANDLSSTFVPNCAIASHHKTYLAKVISYYSVIKMKLVENNTIIRGPNCLFIDYDPEQHIYKFYFLSSNRIVALILYLFILWINAGKGN